MKKFLLGFTALMMLSSTAMAGFLIDPYLGFKMSGEIDETGGNSDADAYDYSGLGFGARVGYNYLGLIFGAVYDISSSELEQTKDPNGTQKGQKVDADFTNAGIFVGYALPMMFRFWGTYYLSSEMEVQGGVNKGELSFSDTAVSTYNGGGYALGVGYTGLPFLSLNFEYRKFTYDELSVQTFSDVSLPMSNHASLGSMGELSASEYFISVSMPIEL